MLLKLIYNTLIRLILLPSYHNLTKCSTVFAQYCVYKKSITCWQLCEEGVVIKCQQMKNREREREREKRFLATRRKKSVQFNLQVAPEKRPKSKRFHFCGGAVYLTPRPCQPFLSFHHFSLPSVC